MHYISSSIMENLSKEPVYDVLPVRLNKNRIVSCLRQSKRLIGLSKVRENSTWTAEWNTTVFDENKEYLPKQYPWGVVRLNNDEDTIIIRHREGLKFYQPDVGAGKLRYLTQDAIFHDINGWYHENSLLLWGWFYSDKNHLGVLSRDIKGKVRFYSIKKEHVLGNKPSSHPLREMKKKITLNDEWQSPDSDIFMTFMPRQQQHIIGTRSSTALRFYKFDSRFNLIQLHETDKFKNSEMNVQTVDRVFFLNLKNGAFQDALHFNNTGLYTYIFDSTTNDYNLVHHDDAFEPKNGWLSDHFDTIKIFDINNDSIDELTFTGPEGFSVLSFNGFSNTWGTLISPNNLLPRERYGNALGLFQESADDLRAFWFQTQEGDVILMSFTEKIVEENNTSSSSTEYSFPTYKHLEESQNLFDKIKNVTPKFCEKNCTPPRNELRWAETWDNSILDRIVDPAQGHVKIFLPLIGHSLSAILKLNVNLDYDQSNENSIVGLKWSLPLAQDFIIVDFDDSVFSEKAVYYLMQSGQPNPLAVTKDQKGVVELKLIANESLKIKYYRYSEQWILEDENTMRVYGKARNKSARDAIQYTLNWPNWRGVGRDKSTLKPIANAWYLNELISISEKRSLYNYYDINKSLRKDGLHYDKSVFLTEITNALDFTLKFKYNPKNHSEFRLYEPINEKGDIYFPVPLEESHYLDRFELETNRFHQEIQFCYTLENNSVRLLKSIRQNYLWGHETVLQFEYEKGVLGLLKTLITPTGLSIDVKYSRSEMNLFLEKKSIRVNSSENSQLFTGPNYAILAERVGRDLNISVLSRDMTVVKKNVASIELPANKKYLLTTFSDAFSLFVERYDESKVLHLFIYDGHRWVQDASKNYSKNTIVAVNNKVLNIFINPNSVVQLSPENAKWTSCQLTTVASQIARIGSHDDSIALYDEQNIILIYRDRNKNLIEKLVHKGAAIKFEFEKFILGKTSLDEFITNGRKKGLQIFKNVIVLGDFQVKENSVSYGLNIFQLNGNRNTSKYTRLIGKTVNLQDLKRKVEHEGSFFHLGYVFEKGFYRLKVLAAEGKIMENIRGQSQREQALVQINDALKSQLETSSLLPRYEFILNARGIQDSEGNLFRFTGSQWEHVVPSSNENVSYNLGENFEIEVNGDGKQLRLFSVDKSQKRKHLLKEICPTVANLISIRFPYYIAYQKSVDVIEIIRFHDEHTIESEKLVKGETLVPFDSDYSMVTKKDDYIFVYPLKYISRIENEKAMTYVSSVEISLGSDKRITSYERYLTESSEGDITLKLISIPSGSKTEFGWIEDVWVTTKEQINVTSIRNWYDAKGDIVLLPKRCEDCKTDSVTEPKNKLTQVRDQSGKWVIYDTTPNTIQDEMTVYFGFENYEIDLIGNPTNNNHWKIINGQISSEKLSFTGKNYLELRPSHKNIQSAFEGTLTPRDQNCNYVFSGWLRTNYTAEIYSPLIFLKVVFSSELEQSFATWKSLVKRIQGQWLYWESTIDFKVVKSLYDDYLSMKNATIVTPQNATIGPAYFRKVDKTHFKITVRIETDDKHFIDLDHIRFAPLTILPEFTVYDESNGVITEIILGNGSIFRTVYDHMAREIADVDGEGHVNELKSCTTSGRLATVPIGAQSNTHPSCITFQLEGGKYLTFDELIAGNELKAENFDGVISSRYFKHIGSNKGIIHFNPSLFVDNNGHTTFRCYLTLLESSSELSMTWLPENMISFSRSNTTASLTMSTGLYINDLPTSFELILTLIKNRLIIWCDSVLTVDQIFLSETDVNPWFMFSVHATKSVIIENFFILNVPRIKVVYYNAWGEKVQELQMEEENQIILSETIYDAMSRPVIITKPTRMLVGINDTLFSFKKDFIDDNLLSGVWKNDVLQGLVDKLNPDEEGFAYTRTEYYPDPLGHKKCVGLPGKDYSIHGKYPIRYMRHTDSFFLNDIFPDEYGYRKVLQILPNNSQKFKVYDSKNNRVAEYIQVAGMKPIISTYEYDKSDKLVKILPPAYHNEVKTFATSRVWEPNDTLLTNGERYFQEKLGIFYDYDDYGRLRKTKSPDMDDVDIIYDTKNRRRFTASINNVNQTALVSYIEQNENGELVRSGFIISPVPLAKLKNISNYANFPPHEDFQVVYHENDHPDSLQRGRTKRFLTFTHNIAVIEQMVFNNQDQITEKTVLLKTGEKNHVVKNYILKKSIKGNKVRELWYPFNYKGQKLHLTYHYNNLGKLSKINHNNSSLFTFSYNSNGLIASENVKIHNFTRTFDYNSPGFIVKITDPFLTQKLSYTEQGYGQKGFGDGSVMSTIFNATWTIGMDQKKIQPNSSSRENILPACFSSLKRKGYLNNLGIPIKMLSKYSNDLPLMCRGKTGALISKFLSETYYPQNYGYSFSYGNNKDLVKAKFFTNENVGSIQPLQSKSFSEAIANFTIKDSQKIWSILSTNGYIIPDQVQPDDETAIGKPGKSLLRDYDLRMKLESLNAEFIGYWTSITNIILSSISNRENVSLTHFKNAFLDCNGAWDETSDLAITQLENEASLIYDMLVKENFLGQLGYFKSALDSSLVQLLNQYEKNIPDIIKVMMNHFNFRIGESTNDLESFDIDPNGNHKHFYNGFRRFQLNYVQFTNKISNITMTDPTIGSIEQVFKVKHDNFGNVVQALHLGIEGIKYHRVSQRPTLMELSDGRQLKFLYDSMGERVLKQTFSSTRYLQKEVQYLRDERGRVLLDETTLYKTNGEKANKVTTAYLYGPKGMLGFFRNNVFYTVTTDHAGSIRLIMRDGEVVTSYDYLPYGQTIRTFNKDSQAIISYRYTGQEFDEETGLYNFHARLYDPMIGRFYQPDPKSQDFSPYKFAGNSPVSNIDPDGEFFFVIALALVGAYLGGAAANGRWNPSKWNYKDLKTYIGMVSGAVTGTLIPGGISNTFAALVPVLGTQGAAIGTAVLAGSGVLAKVISEAHKVDWDFTNPSIYFGGFAGTNTFIHLVPNIKSAHIFAKSLGKYKNLFLGVSYGTGIGVSYLSVSLNNDEFRFWKWKFSDSGLWLDIVNNFARGLKMPTKFIQKAGGLKKFMKSSKIEIPSTITNTKLRKILEDVLGNLKDPFYKALSVGMVASFIEADSDNDILKQVTLSLFPKYEWTFNKMLQGKSYERLLDLATVNIIGNTTNIYAIETFEAENSKLDYLEKLKFKKEMDFIIKEENNRLIEMLFNNKWDPSIFAGFPASQTKQVDEFLQGGVQKWKVGDSTPPPELVNVLKQHLTPSEKDYYELLENLNKDLVNPSGDLTISDGNKGVYGCVEDAGAFSRQHNNKSCLGKGDYSAPLIQTSEVLVDDRKIESFPNENDETIIRSKDLNRALRDVQDHIEGNKYVKNNCKNQKYKSDLPMKSSAARPHVWIESFITNARKAVLSVIPNIHEPWASRNLPSGQNWRNHFHENDDFSAHNGPDEILKLGDQWLSHNNIIGNIHWIMMLSGKWLEFTMPRQYILHDKEDRNTEKFIVSAEFANIFLDLLQEESENMGLSSIIPIINNSSVYNGVLNKVKTCINQNNIDSLPSGLVRCFFLQHGKQIASIVGEKSTGEFQNNTKLRIPELKSELMRLEDNRIERFLQAKSLGKKKAKLSECSAVSFPVSSQQRLADKTTKYLT